MNVDAQLFPQHAKDGSEIVHSRVPLFGEHAVEALGGLAVRGDKPQQGP